MKLSAFFFAAAAISSSCANAAVVASRSPLPPFFLLAGDSTTAKQSSGGGGWGNGFLDTTLRSPATGLNHGHDGATTVSFRSGGDWATVLQQAKDHKGNYSVYITCQFGHNDQKTSSHISLSQYSTNLGVFVDEARAAGADPILVTPLTRRSFSGNPPRVVQGLADQRNATIAVALQRKSKWIDLNRASTDYVNLIGPDVSHVYNLTPDDDTHLNDHGSVVFGRIVSDLLVKKYGEAFGPWTVRNETLSKEIEEGVPA